MTSQGRVRLWTFDSCGIRGLSKTIEFSAYGSYLEHQGDRLIDFNERGISIISQEGEVLWHKDISSFKIVMDGEKIIEQHRHGLEVQTMIRMS